MQVIVAMTVLVTSNVHSKQLPDLGSDARNILSTKDEIMLGNVWLASLRATGKVSQDAIINAYLNYLGKRLAVYSGINSYPVKFFAVVDDSFNAFAFLGGNIGIHEGLITYTSDENELAAVIAHEIAHISQEHMLRQIAMQRQLLPITMAEALAAIALGTPDLILPVLAGHGQQTINFTREHEKEADRVGIQIMAKAGFDPQSMPSLFQSMGQKSRYDTRPPEYLLTHPIYESRIADARHRADSFKYHQSPNSLSYYLVKARIQALAVKNVHDKIAWFEHQLAGQRYENSTACAYGYAIALNLNQEYKKALTILEPLAAKNADEVIIQLALAETDMLAGNIAKANTLMEQLLSLYPDELALILQYSEQMLMQKKYSTAKKWLQQTKDSYPTEPAIYAGLARAESALNNQCNMYEANAEWHLLHGDYINAINQLDMALESTKNEQQKSKIKQRQKQITELLAWTQK